MNSETVETSTACVDTTFEGSTSPSSTKTAVVGALLAVNNLMWPQRRTDSCGSTVTHGEIDARQEHIRQLYLKLLAEMAKLTPEALEPGVRRTTLSFLPQLAETSGDVFWEAMERMYFTTSRRLSDRAKASALRFAADYTNSYDRAKVQRFLISRLNSLSPSEASAAAVALSEVGDKYSAPAIRAARSQTRWASVRSDIDETLEDLEGV